jgi:hypothetical protein
MGAFIRAVFVAVLIGFTVGLNVWAGLDQIPAMRGGALNLAVGAGLFTLYITLFLYTLIYTLNRNLLD